jgi:predicted glycosyltransferase
LLIEEEGDYTEFIMKVLNTAIQTTQDIQPDPKERTVSEIFTAFNQQLFWVAQEKQYQDLLKDVDDKRKRPQQRQQQEETTEVICNFFDAILETN